MAVFVGFGFFGLSDFFISIFIPSPKSSQTLSCRGIRISFGSNLSLWKSESVWNVIWFS